MKQSYALKTFLFQKKMSKVDVSIPNFNTFWKENFVLYVLDQHSKNHITLSKKFFSFMNFFFHLTIVPSVLNRATIRLLLLVREIESPILTFINLYVALHQIRGSLWSLDFVSVPSSCKLSFFLLDFDFLEKNILQWSWFFF